MSSLPVCRPHERDGRATRSTRETAIDLRVRLSTHDATCGAPTGQRFFDHMLAAFALYADLSVEGEVRSLDGITHHVVEDVALVLGAAVANALGNRVGIERFGYAYVAMDDAMTRVVIDCGGRAFSRIDLPIETSSVEGLEVALVRHFFRSFAQSLGATLHLDLLAGNDPHHAVESAFKACARACRDAWAVRPEGGIFSTKGTLA